MCNIDFDPNNFWGTNYDNGTWDTTQHNTFTTTIWYTCPFCGKLLEYCYKYCTHCGKLVFPEPEPDYKEIIAKLDEMIKELNELKAGLVKK